MKDNLPFYYADYTFKRWIVDKHLGDDTPTGDLAYDIDQDDQFPDSADFIIVKRHLANRAPCRECWEAFLNAWKRYTNWLLRKWK